MVATVLRVSGEINGAFVPLGTASRLTGGAGSSMSPDEYEALINPIAAGVGVTGGRIGFVAFFLFGVDGAASFPFGRGSAGTVFLFLLILATFGGESLAASTLIMGDAAFRRADLLEDILIVLVGIEIALVKRLGPRRSGFDRPKREKRIAAVFDAYHQCQLLRI